MEFSVLGKWGDGRFEDRPQTVLPSSKTLPGQTRRKVPTLDPEAGPLTGAEIEARLEELDTDDRYSDLGIAGTGGMGEVRWLFDRDLHRVVAMKSIHPGRSSGEELSEHFLTEARVTAQLSHPGVVPVHELGTLPDGRPYFTMKAIRGETLAEMARRRTGGDSEVTIHTLVDVVRRACDAVGFAHSRGILHRDLKPENILIGDFGTVTVLDWGLAIYADGEGDTAATVAPTAMQITGTPGFIAPELLDGSAAQETPQSDVYSLGMTLWCALGGKEPFGADADQAIRRTIAHSFTDDLEGLAPQGLRDLVYAATARVPSDRPSHAGALGKSLTRWLHGVDQERRADEAVERAREHRERAEQLRAEARSLEDQAVAVGDGIDPGAEPASKAELWRIQDQMAALHERADIEVGFAVQHAQASLSFVPNHPGARSLLADHYQTEHLTATERRDKRMAAQSEVLLRAYDDGRWAQYLDGSAAFRIVTDPPDARIEVLKFEERDRRLSPERTGWTPENSVLESGSYVARLTAPGFASVRYPFVIERGQHWSAVPPGGSTARPVALPDASDLDEQDVFVPAGWFRCGGDPMADGSPLAGTSVWLDDFVIRQNPVTNGEYLEFLNDLLAQGREPEAIAACPQERASAGQREPILVHEFDRATGEFRFQPDADGDLWKVEEPVRQVDWFGACAYADWRSERDGISWRLPTEHEWEKAARGVDRRVHPWGSTFDPSFCVMRDSLCGDFVVRPVGHARDESPYGMRDAAGGVNEWCADPYSEAGAPVVEGRPFPDALPAEIPFRVVRGGSWTDAEGRCRVAWREGPPITYRMHSLGFRIARSWARR